MTKLADKIEALGEALHGLSARLLLTGALDNDMNHEAYEQVVKRFDALAREASK